VVRGRSTAGGCRAPAQSLRTFSRPSRTLRVALRVS
jgi:hypothetical protein